MKAHTPGKYGRDKCLHFPITVSAQCRLHCRCRSQRLTIQFSQQPACGNGAAARPTGTGTPLQSAPLSTPPGGPRAPGDSSIRCQLSCRPGRRFVVVGGSAIVWRRPALPGALRVEPHARSPRLAGPRHAVGDSSRREAQGGVGEACAGGITARQSPGTFARMCVPRTECRACFDQIGLSMMMPAFRQRSWRSQWRCRRCRSNWALRCAATA